MNDSWGGVPDVMIVETCPKCSKSERSRKCGPAADSKWYALMVFQPTGAEGWNGPPVRNQ